MLGHCDDIMVPMSEEQVQVIQILLRIMYF